jgi:hypothetical protein
MFFRSSRNIDKLKVWEGREKPPERSKMLDERTKSSILRIDVGKKDYRSGFSGGQRDAHRKPPGNVIPSDSSVSGRKISSGTLSTSARYRHFASAASKYSFSECARI